MTTKTIVTLMILDSPACYTLVISVNACLTHDKNIGALVVADHRCIIAILKIFQHCSSVRVCTGQSIVVDAREALASCSAQIYTVFWRSLRVLCDSKLNRAYVSLKELIIYYFITHGDHFCFQFEIIINVLALSDSFDYLCYGSTVIINIFCLTVRGWTFRRQNMTLIDVRF